MKKQKNKVKKLPKTETIGATLLVGVGCSVGVAKIVKGVKSLDLDLLSTTSETGAPTGHGNMFENCVVRENPGAVKVNNPGSLFNKLKREKNGVDIRLADGTCVQCKCCSTPERVVESLMKDGKFRYDGQTVFVTRNQGKCVEQLLKQRGVCVPVKESNYTYNQVRSVTRRGWDSLKFDATDQNLVKASAIFAASVGLGAFYYEHKKNPQTPWWKKAFKSTVFATGGFMIAELSTLLYCQYKRPF
jgi:lipoprotein